MIEKEIKSIIQNIIPNSKVLLFGSRAKKTNHPYSDYDLLVVIKETLPEIQKRVIRRTIRVALAKLHLGFDIVLQSEKEVEEKKELPGHIVREALKHAVVL